VLDGCKIYTGSDRMSPHPDFGGSHYRRICCSMLVVGVTSEREREDLPGLLCVGAPKDYETVVLS
jgi:hypothetical protein